MPKLTLSVDQAVVRQAKRYARARGTSISRLVETFLSVLVRPPVRPDVPPMLRQVRGILKAGDRDEHRRHLVRKHR